MNAMWAVILIAQAVLAARRKDDPRRQWLVWASGESRSHTAVDSQHGEIVCLGKMLWLVKKKKEAPTVIIQQAPAPAQPTTSSQPVMFAAGPGERAYEPRALL